MNLKPCPACGRESAILVPTDVVYCGNFECRMKGPERDHDGSKWNALPRLPREGKNTMSKQTTRKSEAERALLRKALVALVGADGKDELLGMKAVITNEMPEHDSDKAAALGALQALLDTLPEAANG